MTFTDLLIFILLVQIIHFLGTWKLYIKAGRKAWEAAIPIYNAIVLMKIINRSPWWTLLLFIPIVNLIMFPVIWVETLRSFGRNSNTDTFLGICTFGLYIYYINYAQEVTYINDRSLKPRTAAGEWISSILFAVVAATIVHTYVMQPFTIPTSSLEKTLLVGDFLFVSKFHYGARMPMTAISFPMVHDSIPVIGTKSYLDKPQLPYFRLPGFQKIKRNDIVVFSWPTDTLIDINRPGKGFKVKPLDKKSNYVKRCLGIPGDTLEIIDGFVHTNGVKNILPGRAEVQYTFNAYAQKGVSSRRLLAEGFEDFNRTYKIQNITENSFQQLIPYIIGRRGNTVDDFSVITKSKGLPTKLIGKLGLRVSEILEINKQLTLTIKEAAILKKTTWIDSIKQQINSVKVPNESFFPNKIPYDWNEDNFGPLLIPKKGMTIALNRANVPLYKKIIQEYERNKLEFTPTEIKINGKVANQYTFKKDYYWMMGDNRHKSEDSRFWGFVPDDHIVGKPVFIWFSIKGINDGIKNWSIRWDRVFTTVDGPGERLSYFPYFMIFIVLWQGYVFFRKRKSKV